MIALQKLDGTAFMLNAEWIQSVESTPDTLITLTTGLKLLVLDSIDDVVSKFKAYKQEQKFSGDNS